MKKYDFISGLFFLFVGIGACIVSLRLKLGTAQEPGAGFIPFGAAALLGLMSIGLAVKSLSRAGGTSREEEKNPGDVAWTRVGLVLSALLVYGSAKRRHS